MNGEKPEEQSKGSQVATGKRKKDDQGPLKNEPPVKRMCARMSTGGSQGAMRCALCGASFARYKTYEDHLPECQESFSFDPEESDDEKEEVDDEEEEEESEKEKVKIIE